MSTYPEEFSRLEKEYTQLQTENERLRKLLREIKAEPLAAMKIDKVLKNIGD